MSAQYRACMRPRARGQHRDYQVTSESFNKTQRTLDDLDLRCLASKALSECTRLALRYAKRAGKRDIDETRIDDLLPRFIDELRRQRIDTTPTVRDGTRSPLAPEDLLRNDSVS